MLESAACAKVLFPTAEGELDREILNNSAAAAFQRAFPGRCI